MSQHRRLWITGWQKVALKCHPSRVSLGCNKRDLLVVYTAYLSRKLFRGPRGSRANRCFLLKWQSAKLTSLWEFSFYENVATDISEIPWVVIL